MHGLQAALLFSDVQPDYAFFLLGWNDARVQHVKNLVPDWSDFHGRWTMSFGLSGRELRERFATTYLIKRALFSYFFPDMDDAKILAKVQGDETKLTAQIDPRAIDLYERNMRNIVAVCRAQKVKPVFIPQVLNWDQLTSDKPYGWLPFVRDKDLRHYLEAYNQRMETVAREEGAGFVAQALQINYVPSDWIDNGHFSIAGHKKFANVIANYVRNERASPIRP